MSENQLERKLKAVAKLKGISIRQLCLKIDMTESGLSLALKRATIKFATLVLISKILDISPYFFLYKIDKNLADDEIQSLAEIAVKLKENFPFVRQLGTPHGFQAAVLFYEKNAAYIDAGDFLGDLIIAAKSDEESIPLIIEKWKRNVEVSKKRQKKLP